MAAVIVHSDFGAQENKVCHHFHYFPFICHEVMGSDAMILGFWMLSFKFFTLFFIHKVLFHSLFSPSSRGFNSSWLSAVRVVSSAYLRLLIFLSAILIPACAASSPVFSHDVCCIYVKLAGWQYTALTYSFPNLEPVPCFMSGSNCCFLTCCIAVSHCPHCSLKSGQARHELKRLGDSRSHWSCRAFILSWLTQQP